VKSPNRAGQVHRVWLEPSNAPAFPPAIAAILSADLIVVGPGSLFTSILPNLLVLDLAEAIRASRAVKFYICNSPLSRQTDDSVVVIISASLKSTSAITSLTWLFAITNMKKVYLKI